MLSPSATPAAWYGSCNRLPPAAQSRFRPEGHRCRRHCTAAFLPETFTPDFPQTTRSAPLSGYKKIAPKPGLFAKTKRRFIFGAGDGNRTRIKSLGSSHSTIELHLPAHKPRTGRRKTRTHNADIKAYNRRANILQAFFYPNVHIFLHPHPKKQSGNGRDKVPQATSLSSLRTTTFSAHHYHCRRH